MTSTEEIEDEVADGGFADLPLRAELVATLAELGYEEATPIQRQAIPALVAGADVLGQAATGTGKTAAFALPLLQRLGPAPRGPSPVALVLAPTRELAVQVSSAVHRYGRSLGARVAPVYGGQPIYRQLRSLQDGVDVVVGTPGRVIDHLERGSLDLSQVEVVVLDEADEMLDMGFAEDIEAILERTPPGRQTVLFSATMPPRLARIAERHLRNPQRIATGRAEVAPGEAPKVRQVAYLVRRDQRAAALARILDVEDPDATIVFCRTRAEVDQLTEALNGRGYRAESLHGGMDQVARERVMGRLRSGSAELLVATDVAARGLDIDQLTHVVNVEIPSAAEAYVHRIGRVGRAGREGVAITLAEPRQGRQLRELERATGAPIAIEPVPSVADLRARRTSATTDAVRVLVGDPVAEAVDVVDALRADGVDLRDIALAAVSLAHQATGAAVGDDEPELAALSLRPDRDPRPGGGSDRPRPSGAGKGRSGPRPTNPGMAKVYVSAGREARVRPNDLVGAIAGETSLSGKDIGTIDVAPRFSVVEVPEAKVDEVVNALRATTLRGRRVHARPFQE